MTTRASRRLRQGHLQAFIGGPLKQPRRDEFRTVIGAQGLGCAALADQAAQDLDDAFRADTARHIDRQHLADVLLDDRQAFELLAIGAGIEHEVVSPDSVRLGCSLHLIALAGHPTTGSLAGHLETRFLPHYLGLLWNKIWWTE